MRTNRRTPVALALGLIVGLGACSSSDDGTGPDADQDGSFTATISGPVTASLSGFAWQSGTVVDPQTNQSGWVMYMGTATTGGSNVYVVRLGTRPGPGTYNLVDLSESGDLQNGQFAGIVTLFSGSTVTFSGFTSGGTITITSSSEQVVEGTFNLQVTGINPATQLEVTVNAAGGFRAVANAFAFPGI